MKLTLCIVTLLTYIIANNIDSMLAKDLDNLDSFSKENSRIYGTFDATNFRLRRDGKFAVDKIKHRKPKHPPKMELIPADESLQRNQFPQEVEEELGHTGIGKAFGNKGKRKRRGPSFNQ